MGALVNSQLKDKKPVNPWALSQAYEVRGIDLSHHNGRIRYEELDSLDFVFLKVTEGTTLTIKNLKSIIPPFMKKKLQ